MNPIAFEIFGYSIRWYGIMISLGIIAAILLSNYTCKVKKVDNDILLNAFFIALPFAIIGARAYYVFFEFDSYKDNFIDMFNIRQGGLAIHGGLIGGLSAAYIYAKKKGINFLQYADAAAPTIILAQGFGRWGNFFNQEAFGGRVSESFISHFPTFIQKGMLINGSYYHPTFLYESIWDIVICLVLLLILNKFKHINGFTLFSYFGLYSLGRFFVEGLRTDSLMLGPLRMAQVISIVFIVLSAVYLVYSKKNSRIQ
ncbi:MAG: prolipoprotein diacylglyceryl transferase [Clostridiaceae bacterium]